jgi:hypothetical protein
MALETYPPYAIDEYAIRVFDRLGISEVEGTNWLNAGFGPLLIEEYFKHGANLEAAVILRAVGKGTRSLKLAIEIGMSPTDWLNNIEAALSRKISVSDVSDLSVKDELLNVSIDGQSDEFLKTLRICFPEYSNLISSVGSTDVDICEVIKYVRDSEDGSEVEKLLLEGLSLEEISWELMIPSPKPRKIWQRLGASLEEASIRLSNNQRPIDFLDGIDESLHLLAKRPKEKFFLRDNPLKGSRDSGKSIPQMIFDGIADGSLSKTDLHHVGFEIKISTVEDRFESWVPSGFIVQTKTKSKMKNLGAVLIETDGIRYCLIDEPENLVFEKVADIDPAINGLIQSVAPESDFVFKIVTSSFVEILSSINQNELLKQADSIFINEAELVFEENSFATAAWVPENPNSDGQEFLNGLIVKYDKIYVAYPGPYFLGVFDSQEEATQAWKIEVPICSGGTDFDDFNFEIYQHGEEFRSVTNGHRSEVAHQTFIDCLISIQDFRISNQGILCVNLRSDFAETIPDVVNVCAKNALSELPDGSYRDMNLDNRRGGLLEINKQIFLSIRTDDHKIRLVEVNYSEPDAPFHYLAEFGEFESASVPMSGWFYWSIGRLTDGSLIVFDRLDEMEGRALILSTDRSDVEAVADWITDLNNIGDYQVDIRGLAIHIVKEGNAIQFLSEFYSDASETLEVDLSINLSAAELDELWPMLEIGK